MKNKYWLFKKLVVSVVCLTTIMCVLCIFIIYFFAYYNYEKTFEDKIIHKYNYEKNMEIGVYDEWIIGVTTDNIEVLEAIHKEETAKKILENAKLQKEKKKLYRENIDGKYIIYMIEMDYENGEQVFKFSTIKDIYKDNLLEMITVLIITVFIMILISILVIKNICGKIYKSIGGVANDIREMSFNETFIPLNINVKDMEIQLLIDTFNRMGEKIREKENLEKSMLQYISHELKTPVMIISGYAHSAKDKIYPKGSLEKSLDTILTQSNRIGERINELLLITKSSESISNDEYKRIKVNDIITKITTDLSLNFKKNIVINIHEDLYIKGYEKKIEVLFENLIHNQLKFSNKYVEITAYNKDKDIIFLFFNDGASIPKDIKKDLFKPFYKGYNGSSGLGLSICKSIANIHKGDIELEDLEGGVLFKVKLYRDFDGYTK